MDIEKIHQKLRGRFEKAILDLKPANTQSGSDQCIEAAPDRIHEILKYLKEEPDLFFDNIVCISGVDLKERFEVVYHFHSYKQLHRIVIKTALSDRDRPEIESAADLWKGADWLEREIYDMFGIRFKNHPNLKRILCPEDWEGYPLRKDYKHQERYHGVKVGM